MPPKSVGIWHTVSAWFRVREIRWGCDAVADSDMYIYCQIVFSSYTFFLFFVFLLRD